MSTEVLPPQVITTLIIAVKERLAYLTQFLRST